MLLGEKSALLVFGEMRENELRAAEHGFFFLFWQSQRLCWSLRSRGRPGSKLLIFWSSHLRYRVCAARTEYLMRFKQPVHIHNSQRT
jgi:hypothetical protein